MWEVGSGDDKSTRSDKAGNIELREKLETEDMHVGDKLTREII